jgi:hypothetical protein
LQDDPTATVSEVTTPIFLEPFAPTTVTIYMHLRSAGDVAMPMTEPLQATAFAEGTRTGDWFAIGDVNQDPPLDVPPAPTASRSRRILVRVLGGLIIGGTVACLVRLATHAPARQAILRWGLFGQSERILPAGAR